VRKAHEIDDLFNRQVCYSIQNFCLHDQLRVREVNRDIRVRSANQPAKKEKGSTKCRQRNCNANQLHTSERNSIIGEQEEKWPQKGTKDTNTICDFCACLSLLFCHLFDALDIARPPPQHFIDFTDVEAFKSFLLDAG